jgi:hypothetical protein
MAKRGQPNNNSGASGGQTPARQRPIPQRTCVICRQTGAKRSLVRIVRVANPDDAATAPHVEIDATGKRNGRGAYLCDRAACWQRAAEPSNEVLGKALRMTLSNADKQRISEAAAQYMGENGPS